MNKRSPILGFNHNFKHRGLVFHVQTEDSGVRNPHIFTHLYYGGVILSSRKLEYDAEADDEVVKSLMQAQHKAVLKDLKKGAFDEKIDAYLGDTPGLQEPSSAPSDSEPDLNQAASSANGARTAEPAPAAEPAETPAAGPAEAPAAKPAPAAEPAETPAASAPRGKGKRQQERRAAVATPPPDAATESGSKRRPDSDVSAAFRAISRDESVERLEEEGDEDEAPLVVHHAPPSAPPRAGVPRQRLEGNESSGSYSQVRTGRRDAFGRAPSSAVQDERGRSAPVDEMATTQRRPRRRPGVVDEAATTQRRPRRRPGPIPEGARLPSTPPAGGPSGKRRRPSSEGAPVASAPPGKRPTGKQRRVSERTEGGSPGSPVVSRPAVIVGAPPKVVGGAPRREAQGKRPSQGGRKTQPRRAREDGGAAGLFGKDLISEKSLDEVILAYLSDDSGEE